MHRLARGEKVNNSPAWETQPTRMLLNESIARCRAPKQLRAPDKNPINTNACTLSTKTLQILGSPFRIQLNTLISSRIFSMK